MFSGIKDRISNTSKSSRSSTRPIKSNSKDMTDVEVLTLSESTTNLSTSSTIYPSYTQAASNTSYEAFLQDARVRSQQAVPWQGGIVRDESNGARDWLQGSGLEARSQQARVQNQRVAWQGGIVRNEPNGASDWLQSCGLAERRVRSQQRVTWQGGIVRNEPHGASDWLQSCGLAK